MKIVSSINWVLFLSLFLMNCSSESETNGACNRLGCIPNVSVNTSTTNEQNIIQYTTGGINDIIIYKSGTTYLAYDLQDPNKCSYDADNQLTVSSDQNYLISATGEQYLLFNGQPTKGVSCRNLIRYNISINGGIITISN